MTTINKYTIQIFEAGEWFGCTDWSITFEGALEIASDMCKYFEEKNVRIIGPDGIIYD